MGQINIANSKGRDATVSTLSVRKAKKVRWCDAQQRQAAGIRVLKASLEKDAAALTKQAGGIEKVADLIIAADPELDIENFGRFLKETSNVFINPEGKVVNKVRQFEVVRNPDGSEKERRPRKVSTSNTAVEGQPVKWTGKLMKKSDVYNKFVFSSKQQIGHINGLTYDFLYGMAKELEEKQSLMLLGSGPKGTGPLVFQRGGQNYRGFLEGRTDGNKYCLLLHLSNLELKAPPRPPEAPAEAAKPAALVAAPASTPKPEPATAVTPAVKPPAEPATPSADVADAKAAKPKRAPRKKKDA
ncbi:hypothetical protein [Humisphaera borealis]|uniref:Uncharacterized protein n=1 Tax=Humisphaera borealis TaxID=2807512 RepID=A0A7M2WR54_9BACT|nr:hypothetical protein [Humisphaera borealis]QOV88017.1 hypothetical protein IPV69_17315 [Humisphaera borealis]